MPVSGLLSMNCVIIIIYIIRIIITCVGRNSDVHFFMYLFILIFFITIVFLLTFTRTLYTNFPFTGQ